MFSTLNSTQHTQYKAPRKLSSKSLHLVTKSRRASDAGPQSGKHVETGQRKISEPVMTLDQMANLKPGEIDCPCLLHCSKNRIQNKSSNYFDRYSMQDVEKILESDAKKTRPLSDISLNNKRKKRSQSNSFTSQLGIVEEKKESFYENIVEEVEYRSISTQTDYRQKLICGCFPRRF